VIPTFRGSLCAQWCCGRVAVAGWLVRHLLELARGDAGRGFFPASSVLAAALRLAPRPRLGRSYLIPLGFSSTPRAPSCGVVPVRFRRTRGSFTRGDGCGSGGVSGAGARDSGPPPRLRAHPCHARRGRDLLRSLGHLCVGGWRYMPWGGVFRRSRTPRGSGVAVRLAGGRYNHPDGDSECGLLEAWRDARRLLRVNSSAAGLQVLSFAVSSRPRTGGRGSEPARGGASFAGTPVRRG